MSESAVNGIAQFMAGRRELAFPFSFEFRHGGQSQDVVCDALFRLLPGRRLVARGRLAGQQVLCKLFAGRRGKRDLMRELQGLSVLHGAGIIAPDVLGQGLCGSACHVLLLEYFDQAQSADELDLQESHRWAARAVADLARLHQQGFLQTDPHLDNFLIKDDRLIMIDGGGIRAARTSAACVDNLTEFIAHLPWLRSADDLGVLLDSYRRSSEEPRLPELNEIWRKVGQYRQRRQRKYLRKIYRDCTEFYCTRSVDSLVICRRDALSESMPSLLEDPDKWMQAGRPLKTGNSTTVTVVEVDGRCLVLKRNNMKSPGHLLRRLLRRSRAWRAWYNAHLLRDEGIPALVPVALIEKRLAGLSTTSYFVSDQVTGPDCADYFQEKGSDLIAAQDIAGLLNRLWQAGLVHGDLKYSNIIMSPAGPVFIDLDSLKSAAADRGGLVAGDRRRFLRNWTTSPALAGLFADLLKENTTTARNTTGRNTTG